MNVPEVRLKRIELEKKILNLIKEFEDETESSVTEIELRQATVLGSYQSHTISVSVGVTI